MTHKGFHGVFPYLVSLWESLAEHPSAVPLGDAHRAVIDERLAEHERKSGVQ